MNRWRERVVPGARHEGAVHLDEAVFGVIEIAVGTVVPEVARGIVGVAVHAVVVAAETKLHGESAVLVPAVTVAVVVVFSATQPHKGNRIIETYGAGDGNRTHVRMLGRFGRNQYHRKTNGHQQTGGHIAGSAERVLLSES
jgi:hypothetical protein